MAYGKRKKGGQRLMEISRSGVGRRAVNARRKAAAKKKSTALEAKAKLESMRKQLGVRKSSPSRGRTKVQITMKPKNKTLEAAKRNIAKGPVTRTVKKAATTKPAKKPAAKKPAKTDAQKLADYRKNPTKGMAPRNLRTPAQRAALRKRLMNQKSEAEGIQKTLNEQIGHLDEGRDAMYDAMWNTAGLVAGGPLVGLGRRAAARTAKTALGKKVKEQVAKRGFTKEGKRLKKAGNYRDTKGRIQKIDHKKDKSKNVFLGGAKKKSKSDAIEIDIYGPRPKSVFNPKGVPATKGAAKSKTTPKAEPKPEPKPKVKTKSKAKTPSKKKADKKAPAKKKAVKKTTNKRTTNKPIGSKKGTKGRTNKKTTNKPVGSGKGTKGRKPKNKQEQFKQRRLGGFR